MVDFPAPLSPTNPTRSPGSTRNESLWCAARRPPGYAKDTSSNSTTGASGPSSSTGSAGGPTLGRAFSTAKMSSAAARAHHSVVQQRAEIALGTEHLDAHHQDDEQHVEAHLALRHPPGPRTRAPPRSPPRCRYR